MIRSAILLAAIVHVLVASATAGKQCPKSLRTVRQGPTKQSWTKAIYGVRRGMTVDALEKLLKRVLKTDDLDFRETSLKGGSDWQVTYYVLDLDWGLFIVHDFDKVRRFWIGGTEDLKREVDAAIFPLVRAIHRAPTLFGGGYEFDPAEMVRAVNTLQAAGFKQSLRALREYDRLRSKPDNYLRHHKFDHMRITLIGQLLFVPKAKGKQLPIPMFGLPAPDFKFLDVPGWLKKHESGDPDWPYFPLTLADDVPLLLVRGYTLGGLPTLPREVLDYAEKNCKLRERPLKPSSTPWSAVETFLASPAARRERELQSEKYMLRLEVLRALLPAADKLRRNKIRRHLATEKLPEKDWQALCKWFIAHRTFWNSRTQSYQRR
ncbi:MAG: hypothetical protein ACE5KM_18690 [Planctomycetaceae bacterium]